MVRDDLLYDLIFSKNNDYEINITDYIEDIYMYDIFIDDIREILRKSKVMIVKEKIKVDVDEIIWTLKIKK